MGDKGDPNNLQERAPSQLLSLYANVLDELLGRKIIGSTNNPVADVAEFLAIRALDLSQAQKSTKGYDAEDTNGKRYEIKGRRLTSHNRSRQLSVIRALEQRHFDYLAGVLFAEDFSVLRACLIPVAVVERTAAFSKHVNGWLLHLRDSLWEEPEVRDITSEVRAIEGQLLRPLVSDKGKPSQ